MKSNYQILKSSLIVAVALLGLQGCATRSTPSVSETQSPAMGYGYQSSDVESDLFMLTKKVPSNRSRGDTFSYEYTVEAKENLSDLVLKDSLPAGLEYVSSNPTAAQYDDDLVWSLGDLDAGSVLNATLTVKATDVGTFANCATITASPRACVAVVIGAPELIIDKVVDNNTLIVGSTANFSITVTNVGNSQARNVVITDALPEGLIAASPVSFNIGNLEPAESKTINVTATTTRSGEFNNVATASGSNATEVMDDAPVLVIAPGLSVTKTGSDKQFVGKRASYTVVVENIGDMTLTDVDVVDSVGAGMSLISAPGASVSENTAAWRINSLAAGDTKEFNIVTGAALAGTYCNSVSVVDADLGLSTSDTACTVWSGYPAVLLEVIDTNDPLLIGERSTYVIRVENQGNATDYDIDVSAVIPKELKVLDATGPTDSTIRGGEVTFATIRELKAKTSLEYRINVEGATLGGARSNFELNTRVLQTSISETESTQVY